MSKSEEANVKSQTYYAATVYHNEIELSGSSLESLRPPMALNTVSRHG